MEIKDYLNIKNKLSNHEVNVLIDNELEKIKHIQYLHYLYDLIQSIKETQLDFQKSTKIKVELNTNSNGIYFKFFLVEEVSVTTNKLGTSNKIQHSTAIINPIKNFINNIEISEVLAQIKTNSFYELTEIGLKKLFNDFLPSSLKINLQQATLDTTLKTNTKSNKIKKI